MKQTLKQIIREEVKRALIKERSYAPDVSDREIAVDQLQDHMMNGAREFVIQYLEKNGIGETPKQRANYVADFELEIEDQLVESMSRWNMRWLNWEPTSR